MKVRRIDRSADREWKEPIPVRAQGAPHTVHLHGLFSSLRRRSGLPREFISLPRPGARQVAKERGKQRCLYTSFCP